MVYKRKPDRFKARCTAQGCSQAPGDISETSAPVCRIDTVRTLLPEAPAQGLSVRSLDVRQAYIQAPWLGKPVYMYPAEGWKNGQKVLAIDRAIYGLAESRLAWYKELKRFLTSEEGGSLIPSEADPCLFSNAAKTKALDKFVATVSRQWDI